MDTRLENVVNDFFDEFFNFYYPNYDILKPYKEIIREDCFIYWIDPYELWYYYSIGYINRFVYNYYDYDYDFRVFEKNIGIAINKFGLSCQNRALNIIRHELLEVQDYNKKYNMEVYNPLEQEYQKFHIEFIWKTTGKHPCDECDKKDGKVITLDMLDTHPGCKCQIIEQTWYDNGPITEKIL